MRRCLAAALLLGAACARIASYTRDPLPCQAQAVDVVWRVTYGRTDPTPTIWWVPPAAQNCQEPGRNPGYKMGTLCVGGDAWRDGANLVWYGSWQATDLAHEFAHVAQARDGLPPDLTHTTAPFLPGGLVAQANTRLAAMGPCR
jgi:hypothetical protein